MVCPGLSWYHLEVTSLLSLLSPSPPLNASGIDQVICGFQISAQVIFHLY